MKWKTDHKDFEMHLSINTKCHELSIFNSERLFYKWRVLNISIWIANFNMVPMIVFNLKHHLEMYLSHLGQIPNNTLYTSSESIQYFHEIMPLWLFGRSLSRAFLCAKWYTRHPCFMHLMDVCIWCKSASSHVVCNLGLDNGIWQYLRVPSFAKGAETTVNMIKSTHSVP